MRYKEISGNHYEAQNSNGETIGRIKSDLFPSGEVINGIPIGEWFFVLYRVENDEDFKISTPPIATLNQAKAVLEYHLETA